ncbi:MAG TPA: hypothetical protein VMQ62_09010 [Dongiaceae bacterium]|nr:hypothetical protein [Dongiaceae bacterium]
MPRAVSITAGLFLGLIASACSGRPAPPPVETTSAQALPFIADDAPRALADAKTRAVPVFVEAWAPW